MRFSRRQQLAVGMSILISLAGWMWLVPLVAANQARSPLLAIGPDQPISWAVSARQDQPSRCDTADVNRDGAINVADVAYLGLHPGESQTLDLVTVALIGVCYGAPTGSAVPFKPQLPTSALLPGAAGQDHPLVTISVNPDSSRVSMNHTFDVNIALSTTVPTRAAQFGLSFNPVLLRCESISAGSYYRDWVQAHASTLMLIPVPTCNNAQGMVTDMGVVIGSAAGGPQGSGTVAHIRFTALASGLSPLNLVHVQVIDAGAAPLPITIEDGEALVDGAASGQSVNVSVDATVPSAYLLYFPLVRRSAPVMTQANCGDECDDALPLVTQVSRDVRAVAQWLSALPRHWMVGRYD